MSSTLNKVLIFAAGAAVGSVVTWKVIESKYAQMAREEVEAVRDLYRESHIDEESEDESEPDPSVEDDIPARRRRSDNPMRREYNDLLKTEGYTNYAGTNSDVENDEEVSDVEKPYILSPAEFSSNEEYQTETLFYFDDGVLTDDDYNPIEDVGGIVGTESLTTFGQYEPDAVYVRNERHLTDYEIILDVRRFADLPKSKPHSMEVE